MFDLLQRELLRDVSDDFEKVDMVVAAMNASHPKLFHTKESLARRVFFHKPATIIPHERAITKSLAYA